jgi:hypothetical protein
MNKNGMMEMIEMGRKTGALTSLDFFIVMKRHLTYCHIS